MNLQYQHLLPPDFSPSSRVWLYQSSRLFSLQEAFEIEDLLSEFCDAWQSHGEKVKGYGNLLFGQFVVLMADETTSQVSGCSTDSSVRFIKNLEKKYGVDFFNRTNLAFVINEKIQLLPLSQLSYAFANGFIKKDTLFFNNAIQTKQELDNNWIIPVKASWLDKKIKMGV